MSTIVDITNIVLRWFKFLDEDVCLNNYNRELAIMMYNREYDDVRWFLEDLVQRGIYVPDSEDDDQYLYDYLFENIFDHLITPIEELIGDHSLLVHVKVYTVNDAPTVVLGTFHTNTHTQ